MLFTDHQKNEEYNARDAIDLLPTHALLSCPGVTRYIFFSFFFRLFLKLLTGTF